MNKAYRLLLWLAMLSKRLYKKPAFLVLLALIPVLVLGYVSVAAGESGVVHVGLVCQEEDPITQEIFDELQTGSELLTFRYFADLRDAQSLLKSGKLDAIWLFPGNMEEKIEKFTQNNFSSNAFITVQEREDSVALMLSREKLNSTVYPHIANRVYVHFLRNLAPELSHLSDRQLLDYYFATDLSVNLFEFEGAAGQKKTGYLLSPLRGLLGTLILLCALAAEMYYISDEKRGVFGWISRRWRFLPELGCQITAVLHISAACLICLAVCGLAGNIRTELAVLFLYSLCCSLLAMALRQLCGSLKALSILLPLIIVLVLVICPVFFDLGALRPAQYLLPPTYYINAVYDSRWLLYMVGYLAVTAGATVFIPCVKTAFSGIK